MFLMFSRHHFERCVTKKNKTPEETFSYKIKRERPVFSKDMEQELIGYLLMVEQKYFGLTRPEVMSDGLPIR